MCHPHAKVQKLLPQSSLQQFHQRNHQAAQEADALGNEAENIGGLAPDVRLLNRKSRNNGKKLSNCISHNG